MSGLYIGAAGGFNIKANPSVKNISSSLSTGTGISTPNMNLSTGIGAAAAGTIGYGLGNGLLSSLSIAMPATLLRGSAAIIAAEWARVLGPVALSSLAARWSIWTMTSLASPRGWCLHWCWDWLSTRPLERFSTVPAGTTAITAALAPTITSNDTRAASRPRASSVRRFRSRLYQGWQSRRNTGSWH